MRARITTGLGAAATAVALGLLGASPAFAQGAQGEEPAGGAATKDLVLGFGVGAVLTVLVLAVAVGHRRGRIRWLSRLADFSERASGLPGWAALPSAITGGSLLIAVFGFYWDVAKHIDTGRDASPFGTLAHYPILIGLGGIALGGLVGVVLGSRAPRQPTSLRLAEDWNVPLGAALIFMCGGFALSGFPLDDAWHRLFGQDVTLWGPTHILMIAGAGLSTLAVWVLLVEGRRASEQAGAERVQRPADRLFELTMRLRTLSIAGGFLLGLSALQGEFDYGVPQFQLVYHPIMLMLAAGIGLVAARVCLGRFGALQAVGFFILMRGLLTLTIGPVLGGSTLHFPLYLAEAVLVELVAAKVGNDRPITLGVVAGFAIGTVGLAAEWAWSHVWMPLPWPAALLPEAAILGLAAAVAGGVLGGFVGRALHVEHPSPQRAPRWLLPAAVAGAVLCLAWPLPMNAGEAASARVALSEVTPGPDREVAATVSVSPPAAAEKADWLTVTAWQGGGLVVDRLEEVGDGVYRTTKPIPVHGDWKAMVRLHDGRAVRAVPLYLPEDRAIPARGVPAAEQFTRPFVEDKAILQREAVGESSLELPAYLAMLVIAAAWMVALGFGLRRLQHASRGEGEAVRRRRRPRSRPARPVPTS